MTPLVAALLHAGSTLLGDVVGDVTDDRAPCRPRPIHKTIITFANFVEK